MNIALQLSGLPRNVENSYKWIKEGILDKLIFSGHSCDFFISTWQDKNTARLIELFKPVLFEIEEWNGQKEDELGWQTFKNYNYEISPRSSCLAQFYKIMNCNSLRKKYEVDNGFHYSVIFRLRTEIKFNNTIDLKELDIISQSNVPAVFLRQGPNPQHGFLNWTKDTFAFGNNSGMDIYCDTFNHILDIGRLSRVCTAELLLRNWLHLNDIKIFHTSLDYTLTRV